MAVPDPVTGRSGGQVTRLFYAEEVAPVLAQEFPRLRYAAGRLGSGSDVLGFDDAMSRDHDWGCRPTAAGLIAAVQRDRGVPGGEGAPVLSQYWDRPYRHVDPEVFRGLREAISDPGLARLPAELGAPEQWVSDVEMLHRPGQRAALAAAYRSWLSGT